MFDQSVLSPLSSARHLYDSGVISNESLSVFMAFYGSQTGFLQTQHTPHVLAGSDGAVIAGASGGAGRETGCCRGRARLLRAARRPPDESEAPTADDLTFEEQLMRDPSQKPHVTNPGVS